MSDEETKTLEQADGQQDSTIDTITAAQDQPASAPVTPIDWTQELNNLDAKTLRTHPRVAGIIGSEMQKAIAIERQHIQEEEGKRAAQQTEERLRKLAKEDPESFAEQWLTEDQKHNIQTQLDTLRSTVRHELATRIGQGYHGLPEWAELTDEDHQTLVQHLIGRPDDEIIPIYNRLALDLIADRRAKKLAATWREKDLAKEREAIRQEEAAKHLQSTSAPDLSRAKGLPGKPDISTMSDVEFDKFWLSKFK